MLLATREADAILRERNPVILVKTEARELVPLLVAQDDVNVPASAIADGGIEAGRFLREFMFCWHFILYTVGGGSFRNLTRASA